MWVCAAALLNGNDQATVGIAVPTRTPSLALASIAALGGLRVGFFRCFQPLVSLLMRQRWSFDRAVIKPIVNSNALSRSGTGASGSFPWQKRKAMALVGPASGYLI